MRAPPSWQTRRPLPAHYCNILESQDGCWSISRQHDGRRGRKRTSSYFKKDSFEVLHKTSTYISVTYLLLLQKVWKYSHLVRQKYPPKNKSSFTKEEETGYWEVTGRLCSNKVLNFGLVLSTVSCCLCFIS